MGFLVPDDLITSKIDYIELGDQVLVIANDAYMDICKKKKVEIKSIKAKFARPAWGVFNQYIKGTVSDDLNTGDSTMDTVMLRQQKFRILLEEIYEIIDGEDVLIPLTEKLFDRINTDIAIALVAGYDVELTREREEAASILGLFDELKDEKDKKNESKIPDENKVDEEKKDKE